MFNIFYNTLIERLKEIWIFLMAFADDIVLAIQGVTKIKRALKVISEWSKEYEMTFN